MSRCRLAISRSLIGEVRLVKFEVSPTLIASKRFQSSRAIHRQRFASDNADWALIVSEDATILFAPTAR